MTPAFLRRAATGLLSLVLFTVAGLADAQVMYYEAYRPVMVAPVMAPPAYVANYVPAGNYAAVTAFSPPVVAAAPAVAIRAAYPPITAPVAMTTYYAPAVSPVPTTAYYASPVAEAVVPQPVVAAYVPAAVAVPMRRGVFGGYRPVRPAWYIPY